MNSKENIEKLNFLEGEVLCIDKPLRWTSFDIVRKVRNLIKIKKVGHAGTLDPLATGLLIVCTGKMTKQIEGFQGMPKEYTGQLELGKITPSYDLETEVQHFAETGGITNQILFEATQKFMGEIEQIPPVFSAVKVGGQRAYKSAREGKKLKLEPRKILITEFELTKIDLPFVDFRVVCSKGTYIRALVRDFGEALKTGAYMTQLRRTAIGDFRVENAWDIHEFTEKIRQANETEQ